MVGRLRKRPTKMRNQTTIFSETQAANICIYTYSQAFALTFSQQLMLPSTQEQLYEIYASQDTQHQWNKETFKQAPFL
eukprot:4451666-Amphidinium_carterae.3